MPVAVAFINQDKLLVLKQNKNMIVPKTTFAADELSTAKSSGSYLFKGFWGLKRALGLNPDLKWSSKSRSIPKALILIWHSPPVALS